MARFLMLEDTAINLEAIAYVNRITARHLRIYWRVGTADQDSMRELAYEDLKGDKAELFWQVLGREGFYPHN